MRYIQRKYTDLIREVSSKWVNWDPPIPVQVGAYGEIDPETGDLRIEGNVYDAEFQVELKELGSPLCMADHPPEETGIEESVTIATKGAKQLGLKLGPQAGITSIVNVSLTGQWQFAVGKRDALLVMYCPRMRFMPDDGVREKLYHVPKLRYKWLVTSIHVCPAYSMYLSNKSGEKVTLALGGTLPVLAAPGISAGAEGTAGWQSDAQADLLRKGCDKAGKYCYTPLYTMKRRITWTQRLFREEKKVEDGKEDGWEDVVAPWQPLDEDGEEDSLDMGGSPISP